MKLLILLLFLSLESRSQCLTADIAVLVDWSGSEENNEVLLASSVYAFIDDLPIDSNRVRMCLASFASYHMMWSALTGDKSQLTEALRILSKYGASGGTSLSQCIGAAYWELNSDKRKVAHIIILVTDGEIGDMDFTVKTIEYMNTQVPAVIYAVQIGGGIEGYANLLKLTGSPDRIVVSIASQLSKALKALDLCP